MRDHSRGLDDPRGNYQSLRKSISKYPQTAHLSPKLSEVNHRMDARKKSKASMHETTVSETSSPEDSPLCELRMPLRTKGRPRKVHHVDSDEAEEQPQGTGKGFRGRTAKLPVKKSNKSKQSDSSDERQSSSKGTRRVPQAQNQELDSSDYADSGDNEIRISGPHLKGKDKRGKRSVMCEESSSEESPAVKRKRGELGEWRISRSQPTPKNSKQNNNQALTAKKNGGLQRQNQRQPVQSSIQGTKVQTPNKGNKGQTDKQNSDFSLKGCSPVRMKLIVALEQFEEEVDLGPLHHDLLLHPEGHCSCNGLEQLLKRAHQPTCEEPEKRQRQPPIDCWMNKQASDEMEGCSWWPQRFQERKPQLEQMMPPELKAWNVALMSPERALSLRAKPMLASKAPKCSLPVVEDNFGATTENPASGPSSFINLQQYEDDKNLPSSKFESATDLLGPAVKPFMLELPEKALMAECFKAIWGDAAHCVITPEHFDWYTFQGRAIGIQVDLNCSSIFNGKLVLEGYMKKPMWVDHSANTFFNVLRGRVKITINNCEALIAPSQSIIVKSGEVYSIQNVDPQLAVLYFIRIFCD
ncbi:uncharacterized protein isoform X2 [Takifugu rubripes]|uniref:uncharacterized protein isoform X2 n=1 Tax=Takifugu rubripes TaxID=31033 RepID=UPI001145F990|nr:uncharacterized protein LOC105416249 isoform X2 [Takifugu rubripes]